MDNLLNSINKIFVLSQNTLPDGRVFALDKQMIISIVIQLINIIIIFLIMKFLIHKPVTNFLEKRRKEIEEKIIDAENEKNKAIETQNIYNEKIKNIEQEAKHIIDEAKEKSREERYNILVEAHKESDAILDEAKQSIQKSKEKLKKEAEKEVLRLSTLIAEKQIRKNLDENTQKELFEESIKELEDSLWQD